jgi:hypothetical protein
MIKVFWPAGIKMTMAISVNRREILHFVQDVIKDLGHLMRLFAFAQGDSEDGGSSLRSE